MTLRVAQIVATIDDPMAGPSSSVACLARELLAQGIDITLHTVAGWRGRVAAAESRHAFPADRHFQHAQDLSHLPGLAGLCWSESLRRRLNEVADQVDVFHTHGLWLMPNVYPSWSAPSSGSKARIVLSPRGMLGKSALGFSRAKKMVFWTLLQRGALDKVSCFHATAASELSEIRAAGLRQPVAILPNGIDVPQIEVRSAGEVRRTILTYGRIHPIKGLDRLVKAWSEVASRHVDVSLRIAGPDENDHAAELLDLVKSLGVPRVSIEGPLVGEEKSRALKGALVFSLPSLNENFAMTVAEALAAGVPVISSKGAPWKGLVDKRCGWWIDHAGDALAATLDEALSLTEEERRSMGERGRLWMERDFGWPAIAAQMADVYAWLAGRGHRPACVVLD